MAGALLLRLDGEGAVSKRLLDFFAHEADDNDVVAPVCRQRVENVAEKRLSERGAHDLRQLDALGLHTRALSSREDYGFKHFQSPFIMSSFFAVGAGALDRPCLSTTGLRGESRRSRHRRLLPQ